MSEILDFVWMSKYAGERFDIVQAGGGNSSVKLDNNEMIIKASGFLLSDMSIENGYSRVITSSIADIIKNDKILLLSSKIEREKLASKLIEESTLDKRNKPSIETLLHAILFKYTLHTHPLVVNIIVTRSDWKNILCSIFNDMDIVFVDYKTPGIELAIELNKEIEAFGKIPNVIFLQNHGLIVTSNNKNDIKNIQEYVLNRIENFLNIDMGHYKLTNAISTLFGNIEKSENITYLSEDEYIREATRDRNILFYYPFFPDALVYCGFGLVQIWHTDDIKSIVDFKDRYSELPKVVLYKNNLFFRALNIKKAKEAEEVFKINIMILKQNLNHAKNFLNFDEIAYLSSWEAEKYRQKI